MKKLGLAIAVIAVVALAATAFAYGPDHGQWHGRHGCWGQEAGPAIGDEGFGLGLGGHGARRIAHFLNLTDDQKGKMIEVRNKYVGQMKASRDELFQKRQELRNLYTDPKADEGTIMAKQKELASLQQKARDNMMQFALEERRILTPEQLKKLAEFKPGFDGCGKGRRLG
jgi:Spy/CpxP family protein refolding chaperone